MAWLGGELRSLGASSFQSKFIVKVVIVEINYALLTSLQSHTALAANQLHVVCIPMAG